MGIFVATCEEHGILDDVLAESPFDRSYLEEPSHFIDWDNLVTLVDRAANNFSEDEFIKVAADTYSHPLYMVYRLLGKMRFNLTQFYLYLHGPEGIVTNFYPIKSELLNFDPAKRNLTIKMSLMPGLQPCKNFFKIIEGQFIGVPATLGYQRATVIASYTETGALFDVQVPEENGFVPFVRRVLMYPIDIFNTAKALQLTQDTLVKRNHDLEAETQKLIEAKAHLRLQQEQFNLLNSNQSIVFYTLNMNLEPLFFSESIESVFGYSRDEALSLPPLTLIDDSDKALALSKFQEYLAKESTDPFLGSFNIRLLRRRKDQSTFWSDNYVSSLRDDTGKAIGLLGVVVDIENRVELENLQQKLESELIESQQRELLGRIAGGIAHDFNNSLQAIIGFAEIESSNIANKERSRDRANQNIDNILKAASSASDLVRQLLALGRRQSLNITSIDLTNWLKGLKPFISTIVSKHIALEINLEDDLRIQGDTAQLERVIANLAVNAKDAMPDSGTFEIIGKRQGDFVELEFRDTGSGIPEDMIKHIFQPFFTSKDADNGSGLGLAVCVGIIEQHQGHIRVESEIGVGTSIIISLPYSCDQNTQKGKQEQAQQITTGPHTILVVDDQEMIRDMIRSMLLDEAINVLEAKDGFDAVTQYRAHQSEIDLVLIDMMMPGQNGDVTISNIRKVSEHVPVVFMTGYIGEVADLKAMQAETILTKPFTQSDLVAVLREKLPSIADNN